MRYTANTITYFPASSNLNSNKKGVGKKKNSSHPCAFHVAGGQLFAKST